MSRTGWLDERFAEVRPKAIAALDRLFRDLDLAEEAFATACERALSSWHRTGEPADPLAWLLAVARNAGIDILRRRRRQERLQPLADLDLSTDPEAEPIAELDAGDLGDDVLRLLFICCHPALSPQDQAALALRVVGGLSVDEIAEAFLVGPAAMEKRLARAKARIRPARVPFETPSRAERQARLRTVSLMVYLMFNEGWSAFADDEPEQGTLCEEAIRLVRLLLRLFPSEPELQGLLALFLFHYARRHGRQDPTGRLLTLDEQDRSCWDRQMILEGTTLLDKALRHGQAGPYQIQAAIASAHATAPNSAATDWTEIERLYRLLVLLEGTPVARLNHAAALARTRGAEAGLAELDPLAAELDGYRWFHSTRGGLLLELGCRKEAQAAFLRALELGPTAGERAALLEHLARCE